MDLRWNSHWLPDETPRQFNHKEVPGICSKLDSPDIYAFERPFGGRDKINPLRLYEPGRMFLMKATGTMFEDLVAIPGFEPGSAP